MLPLLLIGCEPGSGDGAGDPLPHNEEPWVSDEPLDALANARRFSLLMPEDAPVDVRCVLDEDPTEVHVARAEPARTHEIEVFGLLADADYTCTLSSGSWSEVRQVRTDAPPAYVPRWEVEENAPWWGSYVLLNHGYTTGNRRTTLLIVDREGRLRWYLRVPDNPPDLDAQYLGDGQVLYGGGQEVSPTVVDLAQQVRLKGISAFTGLDYHHHTEKLPSGQVLAMVHDENEAAGDSWTGFGITYLSPNLNLDEWTLRSQDYVDEGAMKVPAPDRDDPWHANAAIDRDGMLYVNLRQAHLLLAFDKDSRELVWRFGPDGDFTLLEDDGSVADPARWAWGAHAPELDGDRLLVYDNGYQRPNAGGFSRLVEFELDVPARTARTVWEYREADWFEQIWGDVDRLPDGQVLFVRAHCEGCGGRPVTTTQVVVVDPDTNLPSWRLAMLDTASAGYRAQALDGCEIFANAKFCDGVLTDR